MTLTIELAPEVERVLERKAQARGVRVEQYLAELAERDAHEAQRDTQREPSLANGAASNGEAVSSNALGGTPEIAARLRALQNIGSYNTRAGLPELDLSGARADVYGYTEREDAQL